MQQGVRGSKPLVRREKERTENRRSDAPSGAAELPAMVARDGIVRGETVEVTMPRHERKKASHAASR